MDEAVEDLVLAPFREIVAQGTAALSNADEAGGRGGEKESKLRAAAQGLMREGERALRRLEPLCWRRGEEFGGAFVDALKDDAYISRLVEQLNDLLYDFEDFVEVASFDGDKFSELQALSRKAAPVISHRITRMKLEFVQGDDDRETTSSSPASFGPTVWLRKPSDEVGSPSSESSAYSETDTHEYTMPWPHNRDLDAKLSDTTSAIQLPTVLEEEPSSPTLELWSARSEDIKQGLELITRRRGTAKSFITTTTTYSDSALGSETTSEIAPSPILQPPVPLKSPARLTPTPTTGPTFDQTANFVRSHYDRDSISPLSPRPPPQNRDSVAVSSVSTNPSVRSSTGADLHIHPLLRSRERDSYFDAAVSPLPPPPNEEELQSRVRAPSPFVSPLFAQQAGNRGAPALPSSSSSSLAWPHDEMESVMLPPPGLVPDGLIPAEEKDVCEPVLPFSGVNAQLGACLMSLSSSYHQLKGCAGAMEIVQGGLGVRYIKKQGMAKGNIEVAKCTACAYELEWKAVQLDVNNAATENFKSQGIGFRLRFLSKSHMHAKKVGEQTYGCLFCVQQHRTTHPNDATVFFSQQQLFAHLARHPRPLPHVPGVTVIQDTVVPAKFANNYDLHFADPPRISPLLPHFMRYLTALPTATAVQTCRPEATMRRPADGTDVLGYAVGARILGVEFPEKYQGKWCLGWADHQNGLMATEALRIDAPADNEARSRGSSSMKAVARWKAAGSKNGKGQWLAFGKGEAITNIGWSHQDHWCWHGTNARGKSGLLLRSFVEPGTLVEDARGSDVASVASSDRRAGLLSRITMRHRSNGSGGGGGGGGGLRARRRARRYPD